MTNKIIEEEVNQQKIDIYSKAMGNLADDFNHEMMTFQELEKAKKNLHKDIFGY